MAIGPKGPSKPPVKTGRAEMGRGISLPFEFTGAVALFWFVGRLMDGWLGTEPWAQVVGSVLGWVGGFLHVYYQTVGKPSGDEKGKQ